MSVCESHSIAGGAAHGFERQGFKFDSGPSLYSGLSYNPRRHQGSYGSAIAAGKGFFLGTKTPVEGLWCCRDSTFLGIGLPAVAASGMISTNSLASVWQHLELLQDLGIV